MGLAHPVAAPLRLEDVHRDQVHRLVGLLRPDAQGPGPAAQRRRDQPDLGLAGLGLRRRPRPPPGERLDHALRRGLGPARPQVRRRDRAQQDARPLSVLQQHLLLRLRRQPYYAYGYGYDINGRNRRESVFAQDAWKPSDRLTLNLGVRMDHMSGGAPDQDAVYTNTVFAPRLGFAFDLTGNHTTVLKGSYSQYYEGIFNDVYKLATTGYAGPHLLGHGRLPGLRLLGTDGRLSLPAVRRATRSTASTQPIGRDRPTTSSTRGSTSGASGSSTSSVRTGASRPPGSTARTRTSSATCCPTRAGRRSASRARRARRSRTAPTAARCRRRPCTAYRWDQPVELRGQPPDHQPGRLPVPRPERQRARDDERLPQVQGADADPQAGATPTAGRARSRTCTRSPRAR